MRQKPQAIKMTERAAERVKHLVAKAEGPCAGLRLGVKSGGCAGFTYDLGYAEKAEPLDEVVELEGATVYIDSKAILYLLGTELDWEESKFSTGFVFNNPNETDRCGCGESFSFGGEGPDGLPAGLNLPDAG